MNFFQQYGETIVIIVATLFPILGVLLPNLTKLSTSLKTMSKLDSIEKSFSESSSQIKPLGEMYTKVENLSKIITKQQDIIALLDTKLDKINEYLCKNMHNYTEDIKEYISNRDMSLDIISTLSDNVVNKNNELEEHLTEIINQSHNAMNFKLDKRDRIIEKISERLKIRDEKEI